MLWLGADAQVVVGTRHLGVGKQLELQEGCGKCHRLDAWQPRIGGGVGNTREIYRPALFSGLQAWTASTSAKRQCAVFVTI